MKKRTHEIKIRLSDEELDYLNSIKTHPQLARWIRETLLSKVNLKNHNNGNSTPNHIQQQRLPEMVRILAGIGNNLNQIAKQLNTLAKIGGLNHVEAIKAITQVSVIERVLNEIKHYVLPEKRKKP